MVRVIELGTLLDWRPGALQVNRDGERVAVEESGDIGFGFTLRMKTWAAVSALSLHGKKVSRFQSPGVEGGGGVCRYPISRLRDQF